MQVIQLPSNKPVFSTGVTRTALSCWLVNHHPHCSLLLMWKVSHKYIMCTTFGTNVDLGGICGLQKRLLLTLHPGDYEPVGFHIHSCVASCHAFVAILYSSVNVFFHWFDQSVSYFPEQSIRCLLYKVSENGGKCWSVYKMSNVHSPKIQIQFTVK